MTVERTLKVAKPGCFLVGDIISFTLTDDESVQALAVKKESDGMIFLLADCLIQKYCMNHKSTNLGGFDTSDLRPQLNHEVFSRFPPELREKIVRFPSGDRLRLPTETEIFGANRYGTIEPDSVVRWGPMMQQKNRVAVQGNSGTGAWYWLSNAMRDSGNLFLIANNIGRVHVSDARAFLNVRPVFKLCNP